MVLPYSSPAHYTLWVTADSPNLGRVIDAPNPIGGQDQVTGLNG